MRYSDANLMKGNQMTSVEADAAARALARWLAPYLREELGATILQGAPERSGDGEENVGEFVSALGDVVVENALTFFGLLAGGGEVTSLQVAEAIGVATPRNIPAVLTTPLKRRAKALGWDAPWIEGALGERTTWSDRDGLASRMVPALAAEKARRGSGGAS
jgi:hypothetical protein